jgi:hypothetical protein
MPVSVAFPCAAKRILFSAMLAHLFDFVKTIQKAMRVMGAVSASSDDRLAW